MRGRFVDEVNRFIRKEPIADVTLRKDRRGHEGRVLDPHPMMDLIALAQPPEARNRVLDRRLGHKHRLKASLKRRAFLVGSKDAYGLTVNQMPGCRVLIAAAEFSTRSAWPRMSIVRTAAGVTPIVSPNVSGGVARPGGARCSHAVRATSAVASMITWPVRIETILY